MGRWPKCYYSGFKKVNLKKHLVATQNVIPLCRDITEADSEWLTSYASDEEVKQTVNQIGQLNASYPNGVRAVFYYKCRNAGTLSIRIFV